MVRNCADSLHDYNGCACHDVFQKACTQRDQKTFSSVIPNKKGHLGGKVIEKQSNDIIISEPYGDWQFKRLRLCVE